MSFVPRKAEIKSYANLQSLISGLILSSNIARTEDDLLDSAREDSKGAKIQIDDEILIRFIHNILTCFSENGTVSWDQESKIFYANTIISR